jgi:hypothetical protein
MTPVDKMQATPLRELRDPLRDTWVPASWSRANSAVGLVELLQLRGKQVRPRGSRRRRGGPDQ